MKEARLEMKRSQNKAEFSLSVRKDTPESEDRSLGSADSFTKEHPVSERLAATNSEGSREKDVENVSEASPFRVHVETEKDSQALLYQAEALIEKGKLDQACELFEDALTAYNGAFEIYSHLEHVQGIVQVKLKTGKVLALKEDVKGSQREFSEALRLSEEHGLLLLTAEALILWGETRRQTGEYHTALEYFKRALKISREQGDRFREERTLGSLGLVYQNLGEYAESIPNYQQALEIAIEIGHKRNQGIHLGNLGMIYRNLGEYDKAVAHYTQAVKILEETENRRGVGLYLGNLGIVFQRRGLRQEAIEYYNRAIEIAKEIGDKRSEGMQLCNIGNVHNNMGEYQQAIVICTKALALFRSAGDRKSECGNLGNLGNMYKNIGDYQQALTTINEPFNRKRLGSKRALGSILGILAICTFRWIVGMMQSSI